MQSPRFPAAPDGSFGKFVLDVSKRTLTREHNWRVTDVEFSEEVFEL